MANQIKDKNGNWAVAGLAFVGCVVVGSGIGQLTNQPGTWSTIGAGAGFLVMAIFFFVSKK